MDADALKSVPLFASLDDAALRELEVWLNEVKVAEGKHLVDEGDYAYDLFVIQDGTAEVTREGDRIAELGPGDFFGEMGVLGGKEGRRNATVVAKSPMKLLTLATYDVDRMKKTAPEMLDKLAAAIEERSGG